MTARPLHQQYIIYKGSSGGGGENPDPATYCPANGYIPDPDIVEPYVPPMEVITPATGEIILLLSSQFTDFIKYRANVSTGQHTDVLYDEDMYVVETKASIGSTTEVTYYFPEPNKLYILKITPTTGNITRFYVSTGGGLSIVEAHFNTPNLTSMASAFLNCYDFENFVYYSTLDLVTTMASAFRGTKLRSFKFPASLLACTTIDSIFLESEIKEVDFNECNMPVLTTVNRAFEYARKIAKIILNINAPLLYNFSYFISFCDNLKIIGLPASISGVSTVIFSNFGQYCVLLKEVITPYIASGINISASSFLLNASSLEKLVLRGHWNLTSLISFLSGTVNLLHIEYDEFLNVSLTHSGKLKTLILPKLMGGTNFQTTSNYLEVLAGLDFQFDNTKGRFTFRGGFPMDTIDLPLFKGEAIHVGSIASNPISVTNIKYINVDWANFDFSTNEASETITIVAKLDAAELNRIFTLLPDVTSFGIRTLAISNNPGYATCNIAIATAKGWSHK